MWERKENIVNMDDAVKSIERRAIRRDGAEKNSIH
jgi:hypothetical protein